MASRNRLNKIKRSNPKRRNDIIKKNILFLFVIILIIFIFIGIFYFNFSKKPEIAVDRKTFCPKETSLIKAHTIFYIDGTDRIPKKYIKKLKDYIYYEEEYLKKYDKLTILVLNDNEEEYTKEIFSMCSPGRGSEINPLFGSPKRVEFMWRKNFDKPLKNLFTKLETLNESNKTFLLEGLEEISSRLDFNRKVKNRKLYIFSDLMQHSKELSLYKQGIINKLSTKEFRENRNFDFSNVDIEIELIKRKKLKKFQTKNFKKKWFNYLNSQ